VLSSSAVMKENLVGAEWPATSAGCTGNTRAMPAMRSGDPVVDIGGLVKTFGRTRALDGLDLVVTPGEVHGFLGPNGAGRSTTLRILLNSTKKGPAGSPLE
jgi:ATPase subunit of ABC transporter with duplicated ATPase domains